MSTMVSGVAVRGAMQELQHKQVHRAPLPLLMDHSGHASHCVAANPDLVTKLGDVDPAAAA